MTRVTRLHRGATVLWTPEEGRAVPVTGRQELTRLVSGWNSYGLGVEVRHATAGARSALVLSLGEDGWLARVRDPDMAKGSWPRSRTVTRLLSDGSLPSAFGDSPWYAPHAGSDLAGALLFAEQVQFDPVVIAAAVWAWLNGEPWPDGLAAGKPGFDPVILGTVREAVDWIAAASDHPWPGEAAQAATELADELDIDRVVATSPGQITARVRGIERRVRFQCAAHRDSPVVRVVGLVDQLGHEFTMELPSRTVVRIKRARASR